MSSQVQNDKQLTIALMGIGSAILTGVILGAIEFWTGLALYSLRIIFFIPVGAYMAGIAAASGYYYGAKLFRQKPAGGVGFSVVLASICTYLLLHYVLYCLMKVDSARIIDNISFWNYLDFDIRNTVLSSKRNTYSFELGSTGGYIYAFIQIMLSSLGGLGLFVLLSFPFCKKCSRYLNETVSQYRYTNQENILSDDIETFVEMLDGNDYLKALEFHSDRMGVPRSSGNHLRTRITMHKCRSCGINHLEFGAARLQGNDWQETPQDKIQLWFDRRLDASNRNAV